MEMKYGGCCSTQSSNLHNVVFFLFYRIRTMAIKFMEIIILAQTSKELVCFLCLYKYLCVPGVGGTFLCLIIWICGLKDSPFHWCTAFVSV